MKIDGVEIVAFQDNRVYTRVSTTKEGVDFVSRPVDSNYDSPCPDRHCGCHQEAGDLPCCCCGFTTEGAEKFWRDHP